MIILVSVTAGGLVIINLVYSSLNDCLFISLSVKVDTLQHICLAKAIWGLGVWCGACVLCCVLCCILLSSWLTYQSSALLAPLFFMVTSGSLRQTAINVMNVFCFILPCLALCKRDSQSDVYNRFKCLSPECRDTADDNFESISSNETV